MSQIEEIISEIEDYFDNCKYQPLSNSKIIVNRDEIEELLDVLKKATPDEIKRYQKMVNNKDAILTDAQKKADAILEKAQAQAAEMVTEHEIMQQAYAQANEVVTIATGQAQEILDKATNEANEIQTSAMNYTDQLLENLQNILSGAVEVTQQHYSSLVGSLQENLNLVNSNRQELRGQNAAGSAGDDSGDGISVIASDSEEQA